MRRTPSVNEIQYVPGVCNIGPAEVGRRRTLGWLGLIATVALLVLLHWRHLGRNWDLLVFIPAFLSASGFLQARFHFCTGYAARGVYNFGRPGQSRAVPDEQSKRVDRRLGNRLMLYAFVIAAAATALAAALS
jgi:ABC-type phosphate/phosphonate transport system permease subunit